jgi:hypothetical protein
MARVPETAPPTLNALFRLDDSPPHLGAEKTRLRRPPRSFA